MECACRSLRFFFGLLEVGARCSCDPALVVAAVEKPVAALVVAAVEEPVAALVVAAVEEPVAALVVAAVEEPVAALALAAATTRKSCFS
jgi:hypothetical protein